MANYLVAARSLNDVIGNDDKIPWRAKGEQKLFKEITMGGVLVMGRKTFDTIGKPLPGRETVIVTRNTSFSHPGCHVRHDLPSALELAATMGDAFIAGGGEIYAQALPLADGIHLTTIQIEAEGNVYFPKVPEGQFSLVREQYYSSNIDYLYQYLERNES